MMWQKSARNILLAMTFASLWVSGCGSGSSANKIIVTVTGTASVMVPTQTQTITSTVTGATDVSSTFACTYTTTPNPTTAVPNPKPSASAACDTAKIPTGDPDAGTPAVGTLTPVTSTSTTVASTATFLAPKDFPDQKAFPNVLVTITATSNADKKTTGKFNIAFDSGIRIHIVPATATLATSATQLFLAEDLTNTVIDPTTLTWAVTFEVTAKINSADCSTGTNSCGSIDKTGLYKAPASVPTAAPSSTTTPVNAAGIVTVYAFSNVDNARIAQAAVTLVKAADIVFSGISPSIAPQGGLQQDIFLAATNANSQMGVSLAPPGIICPNSACTTLDPAQIKVVFTAGSTSTSIGARARLSSQILKTAGHYTVQVTTSNSSVKATGGPFPLDIVPVRPTIVGSNPGNFEQATVSQSSGVPFIIDGGFFGPAGSPTVATTFNGQAVLTNNTLTNSTARRIAGSLTAPSGTTGGLYSFGVQYTTSPGPFSAPTPTTAFTNVAVLPDYGASNKPIDIGSNKPLTLKPLPQPAPANPPVIYCPSSASPVTPPPPAPPMPQVCATAPPLISFGASSAPSSIAIDRIAGVAVVTLAGVNSNNVQFIDLTGATPTMTNQVSSGGNLATSVAVDDHLHVAAVVNYASRSLSVLSIPAGTLLATVDLSSVIPQPVPANPSFVEPFPYSVGIDPFTDRALVAFASTNVGLIINLDPNITFSTDKTVPPQCILPGPTSAPKYCPIGYVTLNSGANPQIAFEPGARLAYATPGGAGLLSAVDLSNTSKGSLGVAIASATRASNVVTVTTSSSHNLNPGNPGTVLISGLPKGTNNMTNFDGSFSVGAVLDATHFQYFQADKDDTTTCTASCLASSGTPFLTYTISASISGIAINPLTRQAILADPNVTFSQLTFIDPQSESVNSMTLFSEETGQVSTGASELGATDVAYQPFSNTAVSFNPKTNEVSLIDPSLAQRPAIVTTGQNGLATGCPTNPPPPSPPCTFTSPTNITISGAIAVDSVNNLALTLNSGSGTITGFKLGNIKPVHVESVQTPAIDAGSANVTKPASLSPAVKITLGKAPTAVSGVKIFGAGFDSGSQVLLDSVAFASSTLGNFSFVNSHEIDVTIPVSVLNAGPRHYALSVMSSSGISSNVSDFTVLEEIPLPNCGVTSTTPPTSVPAAPGGVAIDEVNNLAVVTNTGAGCGQVSVFSLNPANIFSQTIKTIATGDTPTGVAVLPSLAYHGQPAGTSGVALVTNSGSNTVSVIDIVNAVPVLDNSTTPKPIVVNVGAGPSGVAIDQETNLAVIANTTAGTVSTIDLTPLTATPIGTLTPGLVAVDPNPIAVAIDPDRGTNGRGLAVVTCQTTGASSTFGELVGVDIGSTTPIRSTSASASFLSSTPTGVVFDPSVSPALFYAVSTQGNVITAFNPDSGQTSTIKVGINPNAIAYNFQTGTILTVNSLSNTISVVDSQTFTTKATIGIGGTSKFAAAIHTFTNLAVIADQANNRVILFPLPK
jgi:DNA-binding beta-propeller fold protein YncE